MLVASAFGFYELTRVVDLQAQNSSLSSQAVSLEGNDLASASQAFYSHLYKLENGNVNATLDDYAANATVIWSGATQGLGGTYHGDQNIRQLLQTWMGRSTTIYYAVENFNESSASNGTAEVNANLTFSGHGAIFGNFNATVNVSYLFVFRGSWLISQETWVFKIFNTQFAGTDTTFPQWQPTGASISNRSSESPFKNWVYYFGGAAAAVMLMAYLAAIPLFLYARKRSRQR